MLINADFSTRVVMLPEDFEWLPSPIQGVERMMLDRIGDEVARATSLVRYAPNSHFSAHQHDGGEEIYVLKGEFADEHGIYPAGSYLRNPPGTSHSPQIGEKGALIWVKLHQFQGNDLTQTNINTHNQSWYPGLRSGLQVMPLHEFEGEHVALVKWAPFTEFSAHRHWGGEEIVVLEGTFFDEHGEYPKGSWLRSPHQSQHSPFTKQDGATILVKTGHLPLS